MGKVSGNEVIKWIKAEEKLPEMNVKVLVCFDINLPYDMGIRYYLLPREDYVFGWYPGGYPTNNTWWMPLPKPPE